MKCELGIETEAYEKKISGNTKYRSLGEIPCSKGFGPVSSNIMSYLHNFEEEFGIKNPLNPSDSSPMNREQKCPYIMSGVNADLGRIHFALDDNDTEIWVCTRYGTGTNDVWKATIDNPY